MDKAIRNKLEEKFDPKYISTRRGSSGGQLSYIEGSQYIQRFNDATEGEWSYTIVDRIVAERPGQKTKSGAPVFDLVVLVEVCAFGQKRQAFGGSTTPAGECQGDDWKSALTDALKKAIASFGVALDMYTKGELAREAEESGKTPPATTTTTKAPSAGGAAAAPKNRVGLSGRQAAQIATLLKATGMPEEILAEKVSTKFGCLVPALSTEDAAKVITYLESVRDRGKAA